jgi:gas vesicle protein
MNTNKKILTAAAVGVAAGSLLGVLFAPANGKETRKKIHDNSKKLSDGVKNTIEKGKVKLDALKGKNENTIIDRVEPLA